MPEAAPNDSEAQSLDDAWKESRGSRRTSGAADPSAEPDPLERIVRTFDAAAFKQAAAMLDRDGCGAAGGPDAARTGAELCTQAKGYLTAGCCWKRRRLYQAAVAADGKSAQAHAGLAEVRERSGDADGGAQGSA